MTRIVDYLGVTRSRLAGTHAELGDYIRSHRLSHGISLRDASKRVGVSKAYLCGIELGYTLPLESTVRKLSKSFGLDFFELMRLAELVTDDMLRYIMMPDNYRRIVEAVEVKCTKPCRSDGEQCSRPTGQVPASRFVDGGE